MDNLTTRSFLVNIFIGVILNVIAGIVTFYLTQQVVYALALVAGIEAIMIGYLLLNIRKTRNLFGLDNIYPTFEQGPSLKTIAEEISSDFVFWGISAKTLMTNYDFRDQMTNKARGGCKFRIMILNPEFERIGEKAHEEGDTAEMWIADIQTTTMKIKQLREQYQLNIELRYFDQFPVLRGMFVNDHKLYFGWYGIGRQGLRSTLLVLENKPGSFYLPMRRMFNELWDKATDPLSAAPAE